MTSDYPCKLVFFFKIVIVFQKKKAALTMPLCRLKINPSNKFYQL